MKINIRGEKMNITEAMKKYAEEKLQKLNKYIEDSNEITGTILFKVYGPKQKIEVTIPLKSCTLRVEEEGADFYAIIDTSIDKLERQIKKNKTRLVNKRNKSKIDFILDFEPEEENENKIIKRKQVELKPMDEEEAILQMELLGHDFYMFKNIETNKRFLKPLKELSFRQMEILTDFSVNVLHPDVLALLSETDIPIRISNTFNKYSAGTIISESVAGSGEFFFAVEKIGTIEKIAEKKQERIKIYRMFSNKKRKSKDEGFAVYLSDCEESRLKAKIISGLTDTEIFASSEGIILTIDKLGLKPVIKALTEQ